MDRAWLHEVNRAVEQAFEILCKAKVLFRMIPGLHLLEFDEQIEIAPVRIEPVICCGTKNCEAPDPAVRADTDNFVKVLLDNAVHGDSPVLPMISSRVMIVFPDIACDDKNRYAGYEISLKRFRPRAIPEPSGGLTRQKEQWLRGTFVMVRGPGPGCGILNLFNQPDLM